MTNGFIFQCIHPVYMAKLYWRVKRDGKWTWRPAGLRGIDKLWTTVWNYQEEEE